MRKFSFVFAILSFFAISTCYGQGDSCLKLLGPTFADDTAWSNPDSVMVDSCISSPTFGQQYAKGSFQIGFTYYILPTPDGPEDTIIERTWQDIDTNYSSVRNEFDTLEQQYGSYFFRRDEPHVNDTSLGRKSRFFIRFDNYVPIDTIKAYIDRIDHVE